jgi:drug/metabolite transporter (DMT)-like permease
MATVVYVLCALTSSACAWLLARSWQRTRTRLLMWSALCFALLALNNIMLVIDLALWTSHDLSVVRSSTALAAVAVLLYGFVFDLGGGDR